MKTTPRQFYLVKVKITKTQRTTKRFGNKLLKKGRIYEFKRLLAKIQFKDIKHYQKTAGYKLIYIKKTGGKIYK